jgi:hypothetical protein
MTVTPAPLPAARRSRLARLFACIAAAVRAAHAANIPF